MSEASNEAVIPAEGARAEGPSADAPWHIRRLEIWLPLVIVVLDQLTKAIVRANVAALFERRRHPGLHEPHARAEHGRGVRDPEHARTFRSRRS